MTGRSSNCLGGEWSDRESEPKGQFAIEVVPGDRKTSGSLLRIKGKLRVSDLLAVETRYSRNAEPVDLSDYRGIQFLLQGRGYLKVHSLQPSISDWDDYVSEIIPASPEWKVVTLPFSELRQAG